ncbi:hypothetical protein CCM_02565 [Cordyceps militaris CM01]|uniref:BZIP domain-containing protein n=1 Tax=Cordyceps militaris (strain CM01) TaxID=983644 RepID=G3JAH8_CORMM|nr:uncharacterized protein CCM_02565 [Cordyceps militaris CM01]EGX94294.1 hypothetical protein CCM_02565 [Cordyceps militaris CM01]
MHSAEITDASAKLEEQRRRNRLAQRRRRESKSMPGAGHIEQATAQGQRNRASISNSTGNDTLPSSLSEDRDQQASDKAWEFAVDTTFFDHSLEEQDEVVDGCLSSPPPLNVSIHAGAGQTEATDVGDRPEQIAKSLLDRQIMSVDASGHSPTIASASSSPLHQFLMTLQKGDGGRRRTNTSALANNLTFSELSQDSYSRLLSMLPQTQHAQNHRYDGPCKLPQPMPASDYMHLDSTAPVCFSTNSSSSVTTGSGSFSWPRSESRPVTAAGPPSKQESALERIREFVEDAGFESLESMMAAYYRANLSATAHGGARPAQAVGRSRRLRSFLSGIHRSHVEWGEQERSAYREEIVRAAEEIYADELSTMVHAATETSSSKMLSIAGSSKPTAETSRVYIAHRIQNLISDQDIQDFMRKDRQELQDTVAETWSLITQLVQNTGQSPQQKASNLAT